MKMVDSVAGSTIDYKWHKPMGCCSNCGAPLNEYMIGGYRIHNGEFGVSLASNYAIKYLDLDNPSYVE